MARSVDADTTRSSVRKQAACGCGVDARRGDRKAVAVDPVLKSSSLNRLKRIEGQVRGLIRMVEEDRYCADIVTQVAAARESLLAVSRTLLKNHLSHCVRGAIAKGDQEADEMYAELLDLMTRLSR